MIEPINHIITHLRQQAAVVEVDLAAAKGKAHYGGDEQRPERCGCEYHSKYLSFVKLI